jgi:RND family efflux transporter MFP subunit
MIPVSVGSAVVANQSVLLTIAQLDPIEVLFSVPQRNLGDLMKSAKQGEVKVSASLLEGGPAAEGALRFVDSLVDPLTGSVKAKASFENKGMRLWPGAAVEVRQVMRTIKDAVVIPTAAVVQNQRGTIVYVVEAERAVSKPVKVVSVDASGSVVTGLEPGEKVVLDGKQNVRPGSKLVERAKPEAKPEGKSEGKPEGKPAAEGKGKPEGAAKP